MTGRYCECPIGQDCSNHTYHPSLPTTEPQNEISSTWYSNRTSTLVTSYLPRASTFWSTVSTASAVTHLSTHFQGENKESGEGEDSPTTMSPDDVLDLAKTTAKHFDETSTSDSEVDKKLVSTEATVKFSSDLMPTFSPPLTLTVTGKLPTITISSNVVTDDYSSATQFFTDDLSTTDLYETSDPHSSPAVVSSVSSTKSSFSTNTAMIGDNVSKIGVSNAGNESDQSHLLSTVSNLSITQSTVTEETSDAEPDEDDYEDSKLQKSTALPTESATPTYHTMMTSTFPTSLSMEILSTFSTTSSQSDFTMGEAEIQSSSSATDGVPYVPKIDDQKSTTSTHVIDLTERTKSFQSFSTFKFSDKTLTPTQSATTDEYDYEESVIPEYNLTSSESSLVTKPHTLVPPEAFTSRVTAINNTTVMSINRTEENSTFSIHDLTNTATTQDMNFILNKSSSTYIPIEVGSTLVTVKASVGTESSAATSALTTPVEAKTSQVLPVDADYSTSEGHFDEDESKDIPRSTTAEDRFPDYGTVTPDYVDTTVSEPKKCSGAESPCLNGGVCLSLESDTVAS